MRKILFSAYSLDIGGIETALITLLNELIKKEYDITLVLEKKQGVFLEEINDKIKVIEYKPNSNKIVIIRKVFNLCKKIGFTLKYKNKFDFSASYATYSLPSSFIARIASKNNALWVHSEYMQYFDNDRSKYKDFFKKLNVEEFKNIVFVSKNAKKIFENEFEDLCDKCKTINNIIDYQKIIKLSEEKIDVSKEDNTILYVGRLTEEDKKVSRLIEVCKKLKENNINFRTLMIGEGKDEQKYIEKVNEYELSNNIIFLGKKKNPYPYFKISDFLILTSEYEGFPVVYNEAKILNLPIITTDVSDSKEIVGDRFGVVTSKEIDDIYNTTKKVLENKFEIKDKFNVDEFNKNNLEKIEKIIN